MFEELTQKFQGLFRRIAGGGRLTESNLTDIVREVKRTLIAADVNLGVAKQFCKRVKEAVVGEKLEKHFQPAEVFARIVRDELVALMGGEPFALKFHSGRPTVIMLVGLNGAGKTTTAGKLAKFLRRRYQKDVMLVAADLARPAAIEQLQVIGQGLEVPVFTEEPKKSTPPKVCAHAVKLAEREHRDVVILDTAGRLQIDDALMTELAEVKARVTPDEIILVVDGMTGQDAVNSAKGFDERLGVSGVILTKMDGDARGGAALSVREVTSRPIVWIGDGETSDDFREFDPASMASRIIGGGDLALLIDQADKMQSVVDQDQAQEQLDKLFTKTYTLDDFLDHLNMLSKFGGGNMAKLLESMPQDAFPPGLLDDFDDSSLARIRAMIQSMTPKERAKPELIEAMRRRRIAEGAGVTPPEVNELLKAFKAMRKQFEQMLGGQQGGVLGKLASWQFSRKKKKQLREKRKARQHIKLDGRRKKPKKQKRR